MNAFILLLELTIILTVIQPLIDYRERFIDKTGRISALFERIAEVSDDGPLPPLSPAAADMLAFHTQHDGSLALPFILLIGDDMIAGRTATAKARLFEALGQLPDPEGYLLLKGSQFAWGASSEPSVAAAYPRMNLSPSEQARLQACFDHLSSRYEEGISALADWRYMSDVLNERRSCPSLQGAKAPRIKGN